MKILMKLVGAALAVFSASCAYDPYYYPGSVNTSYSVGYGQGFGWGGPTFSTSLFVGTGNPRWGYDPYCRSYFDYTRRSYYDPYLCGYYPIGYRPPVLVGVPHPYGWRGNGFCPPPRRVTSVTIRNYQNRDLAYRRSNFGWANQVQPQRIHRGRPLNGGNFQNSYVRPSPLGGFQSPRREPFSRPEPRQGFRGFPPSRGGLPDNQPPANFPRMDNPRRQPMAPAPGGVRPMAPPDRMSAPPPPIQTSSPPGAQ